MKTINISKSESIRIALQKIGESGYKCITVTDKKNKLIAALLSEKELKKLSRQELEKYNSEIIKKLVKVESGPDNQVIEDRVYSLEEFTKNFLKGEK